MEFHLPKRIKTFYWRVFPVAFVLITYYQIVHDWQLEQFGFDELEDVGTLLFILGVSACEAALVTVFLWYVVELVKKLLRTTE
ncbi:hypothetical protein [Exiguobacterium aurantiacum]|uniref:Uncharacterized protein n=1 Tax=Exiguobacterium aurantiacum TaxID=33987 RepID=A0ABY5FJ30_9BACL|nr:hypothetical protein [Exiguobacterium aurantiacum]UTT41527.1 hypothetical protein NMQ00_08080 [Exiguobacterium aurantiacum]